MSTEETGKSLETRILEDPSASRWLKEQINITSERDIVDAMSDAEALLMVLHARWNTMTEQFKSV